MTFSNFANAIRVLSMEAIQKAKSGHPGAPLGMAEIAETLWRNHLNFIPKILNGVIVIVLCYLTDTLQCCFILCCIFPATI